MCCECERVCCECERVCVRERERETEKETEREIYCVHVHVCVTNLVALLLEFLHRDDAGHTSADDAHLCARKDLAR